MKAFVASGGASKGQYIIGALHSLVENNKSYDIYGGVSIGAIIAGYAAQFNNEAEMIKNLLTLANNITKNTVYSRHFLGRLAGLWKTGIYSSKPLRKFIANNINQDKIKASGKLFRVGATKINGELEDPYIIFTEKSEDLVKAIMASSALSPALEAVEIGNSLFVDGGFQSATTLSSVIEAGATEIDLVVCYPRKLAPFEYGKKLNSIDIIKRELELVLHKLVWNEINQAELINSLVKAGLSDKKYVKLNIICPEKELKIDSLDFNKKDAEKMRNLGYQDASK